MTRRVKQRLIVAGMFGLLAGCASSGEPGGPIIGQPRPQAGQQLSGGDPLLGRNAAGLIALFGQPALDIREGQARKLQFSGINCVLDLYLYPPQWGREPVSTHADARLPDGRDTDRTACSAALRRR